MSDETSFAVTGVYSGLHISAAGTGGLLSVTSEISASTGYAISSRKDGAVPYTELTAVNTQPAEDPASLVVTAHYGQLVALDELDMDIHYTDVPANTQVSVDTTNQKLEISRQSIKGTGLIGSASKEQDAFAMDLKLSLWVNNPSGLKATSALVLSFSSISGGDGSPVRKTLLQKIKINLFS